MQWDPENCEIRKNKSSLTAIIKDPVYLKHTWRIMEKLDTQGEQWWVNKAQWLSYNRTEFLPEAQIFYIHIFLQHDVNLNLWYFKLRLIYLTEFVVLKFLSSSI